MTHSRHHFCIRGNRLSHFEVLKFSKIVFRGRPEHTPFYTGITPRPKVRLTNTIWERGDVSGRVTDQSSSSLLSRQKWHLQYAGISLVDQHRLTRPVRESSNLSMHNGIIVLDGCVNGISVLSITSIFHNTVCVVFVHSNTHTPSTCLVILLRTATKHNPKDGSITNDEWLYWQHGNDSMVIADSLRNECFIND